jgi:hypothetical protein
MSSTPLRHTSLTARRVAAGGAAAAVALALSACGSASGTSGSAAAAPTSAGPSASASPSASAAVASSANAVALQTAALATTSAGSAKLTLDETTQSDGKTVTVQGSGVTDLGSPGNGQFTLSTSGQSVQIRVLDKVAYELLPASLRGKASGGKPWIRIDAADAGADATAVSAPNASQQLSFLKAARDITEVGTETVDGVSTTHYRMQADLSQLKGTLGGASLPTSVPVDVWVNAQHRIVREKVSLSVSVKPSPSAAPQQATNVSTIQLSDFGTPVAVTAPPAGQTGELTGASGSTS